MNNLKKVGLTALAGAMVSVSANAADLSVTGGATLDFYGEEKQTTGIVDRESWFKISLLFIVVTEVYVFHTIFDIDDSRTLI